MCSCVLYVFVFELVCLGVCVYVRFTFSLPWDATTQLSQNAGRQGCGLLRCFGSQGWRETV